MDKKQPEWQFNESIQVGVDYTNTDLVAEYDEQHEGFRDFTAEAEKIIAALNLTTDSVILDIGCGTGGLTTEFSRRCRKVYAVDIAERFVKLDRSRRFPILTSYWRLPGAFALTHFSKPRTAQPPRSPAMPSPAARWSQRRSGFC